MHSQEIPPAGDGAFKEDKPVFQADFSGGSGTERPKSVLATDRFPTDSDALTRLLGQVENVGRCGELEDRDLAHLPPEAQNLAWDSHMGALESPMQHVRLGLFVAAAGQFDHSTPGGQMQLNSFVEKIMSGLNDGMKPEAIKELARLGQSDQGNLPIKDCVYKHLDAFDPNSRAGQLAAREARGENKFSDQIELIANRVVKMSSAPNKTDADIALVKGVLTGNIQIKPTDRDFARLQTLLKSPIKTQPFREDVPLA